MPNIGTMTPVSFNGHDISATSVYATKFLRDSGIGNVFESNQVTAEVTANFPQYVLGQPQGKVLLLTIQIPGQNQTWANLKQLKSWFNARNDEVTLVARNANSDLLELRVKPLGLQSEEGLDWWYTARLWVSTPIWKKQTADDTTQNVAADSGSWTVTNEGSDSVKPRLTLTAKAQKTAGNGPASMLRFTIVNRSPRALLDGNGNPWPICLTEGGFQATYLIRNNLIHPQGYDVHVLVDGVEVNRYLSNWGAGYGGLSMPLTYNMSAATNYIAQRFRLPGCSTQEQSTIDEVGFYLKKAGSPTGALIYKIREDNNGSPGTVIATSNGTTDVATLTSDLSYLSAGFAANPTLNARTWYWLEISPAAIIFSGGSVRLGRTVAAADPTNEFLIRNYEGQYAGLKTSSNESTWGTLANSACAFRVQVTGNAKIWVPMVLEGAVGRTLGCPFSNTVPTIEFAEPGANEGLPENTAWVIDNEVFICRGKHGTNGYHVQKVAARGTGQASHTGGTPAYLVQNYVQLLYNDYRPWDLPPTGFEPAEYAPCIDGIASNNSSLVWKGPFIGVPTRPLSWRPVLDASVPMSATISLDNDAAADATNVTFKDAKAAGNYINRNIVEQRFPAPIKSGSGAITIDETIPAALSIEHLLTNAEGAEEAVATHRASDSGNGKTITTTALQYRYRIRASNDALVGCETSDATVGAGQNGTTSTVWGQVFTLDAPARISSVQMRVKWTTAVDAGITGTLRIIAAPNGAPDNAAAPVIHGTSASIDLSTGFVVDTMKTIVGTFAQPVAIPAGTYCIELKRDQSCTNLLRPSAAGSAYARGVGYRWTENSPATVDNQLCYWFRVFGEGEVQNDTVSGTGGTCDLDNIIVVLDQAITPYILSDVAAQGIVYLTPTITVQHPAGYGADNVIGLTAVMKVNGTLDIDFDAKTVLSDDVDLVDPSCPAAITSLDEFDTYRLEPGDNTVTYAEAGQTGAGVDVRHRYWEQYL